MPKKKKEKEQKRETLSQESEPVSGAFGEQKIRVGSWIGSISISRFQSGRQSRAGLAVFSFPWARSPAAVFLQETEGLLPPPALGKSLGKSLFSSFLSHDYDADGNPAPRQFLCPERDCWEKWNRHSPARGWLLAVTGGSRHRHLLSSETETEGYRGHRGAQTVKRGHRKVTERHREAQRGTEGHRREQRGTEGTEEHRQAQRGTEGHR